MFFASNLDTVTHGIQLAVAPVFLLTAVAGMIGTVAGRLARIIDRARVLEARIDDSPQENPMETEFAELRHLRTRGILVNVCITLLTLCAILIGLTIMALFFGETIDIQIARLVTVLFLAGVSCFLLALLCFLAETLIASQVLNFRRSSHAAKVQPPNP
ncbi:MAG: DUF2721 domain-containing protein [Rhodoferax sp.]|nr:DUF2721 domain-containing protein [Rhodoferax sp.]MCF8211650.1 DUF2721 domain-containing protein [Rhodoferax sp.]